MAAQTTTASGAPQIPTPQLDGVSLTAFTMSEDSPAANPNPIPPRTSSSAHGRKASTDAGRKRHSAHPQSAVTNGVSLDENQIGDKWDADKEKILLGPYDYLFSHPGKDVRSQLIAAFNKWLKVPDTSLQIITDVVGMLHTASLLVDDVEDSSFLRRGIPVAHSIYGVPQTINSANYVYFCALRELRKLKSHHAIDVYADELVNLHRGQGMDLYWRDTLTCPTEAEYLDMVSNKTGGLLRLAVKLMQAESNVPRNYVNLVDLIGVIYQIRDDYLNLASAVYTTNKGMCEDLTEGKFSFPIIHSIRSNPQNQQLLNILRQKPQDDDVKKYAVKYMESTGSFEYTRQMLKGLLSKANKMVDKLDDGRGEGGAIKQILDALAVME